RRSMKTLLLAGVILALGCTPVPVSAAPLSAQTKQDVPGSPTDKSPSGTTNRVPSTTPASPGQGDTTDRATSAPSTRVPARGRPANKIDCERAGGKWQPTQNKCDLGA